MKTSKILITFGVAAVAAIALNVNASDTMLSPRAAGNQIIHTSGTANDPNFVAGNVYAATALSPRAADAQSTKATDASSGASMVLACSKNMTASPKAVQACAMNPADMTCCKAGTK
jgi:hypothetical protein